MQQYINAFRMKCIQNGMYLAWRHDTPHNDTQHNDTRHNGLNRDTQHYSTQHKRHSAPSAALLNVAFLIVMPSAIMLSVVGPEFVSKQDTSCTELNVISKECKQFGMHITWTDFSIQCTCIKLGMQYLVCCIVNRECN